MKKRTEGKVKDDVRDEDLSPKQSEEGSLWGKLFSTAAVAAGGAIAGYIAGRFSAKQEQVKTTSFEHSIKTEGREESITFTSYEGSRSECNGDFRAASREPEASLAGDAEEHQG